MRYYSRLRSLVGSIKFHQESAGMGAKVCESACPETARAQASHAKVCHCK